MRRWVMATLLGAAALASCSDDETPGTPPAALTAEAACDYVATRGSCITYSDASERDLAQLGSACEQYGGSFGTVCPGDGRVGTCIIPTPTCVTGVSLYAPDWTDALGRFMCQNGAWIGPIAPEETASPAAVSCSNRWDGTCVDTSGPMTPTLRSAVERYCTGNENDLLGGACPTPGRTGTCTTNPGALVWETRHYVPATAASDRASCLATGASWTDG
jgi:hypothetical protein